MQNYYTSRSVAYLLIYDANQTTFFVQARCGLTANCIVVNLEIEYYT